VKQFYKKTFHLKKSDTSPEIAIQVTKESDATSLDLTGASATFSMKRGNTTKVDNATASVSDPTNGVVKYLWIAADTDTTGTYRAEFTVTFPSGKIATFPSNGFIEVEILDSI